MSDERLGEIEARVNAATAGPWLTKTSLRGPDFTFIANAPVDVKALLAEVRRLRQQNEWYHNAHLMLANDDIYVFACFTKDDVPALQLPCGDTFAYATADAESVDYADTAELLRISKSEGWPGLVRWIMARREKRGEHAAPIPPVKERMKTIDAMRLRAESAERELAAIRESKPTNPTQTK